MERTDERVVLVTGATSGIGRATALRLAKDGWFVVATGRDETGRDELSIASLNAELKSVGAGLALARDLAPRGAGHELVQRAFAERGRLDAVVHSAGLHRVGTVGRTELDVLDLLWRVNLASAFEIATAAVPVMSVNGGTIVLVASEAGHVAVPNQAAYNVTKAGLLMLGKSIAVDHARDGIRAVTVSPGTTKTPLVERAIASADDPVAYERRLAESRPAFRLGHIAEIVATIIFALSDEVAFLTGSDIAIDGGYTAQ